MGAGVSSLSAGRQLPAACELAACQAFRAARAASRPLENVEMDFPQRCCCFTENAPWAL